MVPAASESDVTESADSLELLRRYAVDGVDEAFAELVRRHLDLVYSAGLRRCLGDTTLAGDVAQTVFLDLARRFRKGGTPGPSGLDAIRSVPAWLYRHAGFVASTAMRSESRRRARETLAMELNPTSEATDWSPVAPILEEALSELSDADRDALVLRYFEKEPYARVGAILAISEDAARMRVDRALDRLRIALEKRGVTSTSGALAALILANGVLPAPSGMAASISAAALAMPVAAGVAPVLAVKPLMLGFATVALVGVLTLGWIGSRLQRDRRLLEQANAELRAELESLRSAAPQSASAADLAELERLRREHEELLRLRGEVARLRRERDARPNVAGVSARPENDNEEETGPQAQFQIEARFIDLADEGLEELNLKWLKDGGTGLIVPEEFKRIHDVVQRLPGVEVLSTPSVVTLSGRQARISIRTGAPVPDLDGDSGDELSLDVIPVLDKATGVIELSLRGGRLPKILPPAGKGEGKFIPAAPRKAPPFATTTVRDGWGFVLRRPGIQSPSESSRSLLILGTVVQIDPAGNRVFPAVGEK